MNVILPPYAGLLGIQLEPATSPDAAPVLRMEFADGLAGRPGNLHGGAIAGLLDMAAYAALVHSLTQAGKEPRFKPIGITIDYLRGGKHRPTFARGRGDGARVAPRCVLRQRRDARPRIACRRQDPS